MQLFLPLPQLDYIAHRNSISSILSTFLHYLSIIIQPLQITLSSFPPTLISIIVVVHFYDFCPFSLHYRFQHFFSDTLPFLSVAFIVIYSFVQDHYIYDNIIISISLPFLLKEENFL